MINDLSWLHFPSIRHYLPLGKITTPCFSFLNMKWDRAGWDECRWMFCILVLAICEVAQLSVQRCREGVVRAFMVLLSLSLVRWIAMEKGPGLMWKGIALQAKMTMEIILHGHSELSTFSAVEGALETTVQISSFSNDAGHVFSIQRVHGPWLVESPISLCLSSVQRYQTQIVLPFVGRTLACDFHLCQQWHLTSHIVLWLEGTLG